MSTEETGLLVDSHLHFDLLSEDVRNDFWQGRLGPLDFLLSAGVWPADTKKNRSLFAKPSGELSRLSAQVAVASGLHPMEVGLREGFLDDAHSTLWELAEQGEVVAIGETGFDLSPGVLRRADGSSFEKGELFLLQQRALAICVEVAERFSLPLIFHSRGAWQATADAVLDLVQKRGLRAMIHCFPGSASEARRLSEAGVYLSFGGVLTWPSARKMKAAVQACHIDRLLLETDSPDLPPQLPDGSRPERNSPSFLPLICQTAASLREMDPGEGALELGRHTRENLFRFLWSRSEDRA